ncbi:E3 ubiquitin-protein ligase RNF25 isoform X1 [Anarrhichthys ocellatus]|uniref:E3 ubiquitin-protein ligase RNF25 isoform X1 n=1 Tax=Anarrhichthys ocellatus TaxID=433405 RepID=UPI0012ED2437|nr:E3 ubiquitin-protein ligase RNF25 isoform X1 [Anarrhichthys ocellatus]
MLRLLQTSHRVTCVVSVLSEIEVLQSIYVDELLVNRRQDGDWEVSLVLYPSTAEDSVSQFVRLTLTLTLDQQYPSSSPAISIHNPRGLSDDKISSVQKCLQLEAQSCLGSPVLYQLIEKAKEILTESNIPHGNCVICLYGFKEEETFSKTSCYHYFHSHCLGRYASHSERELRLREKELEEDKTRDRADRQELTVVCPVCREPLTYDVDQLLCSPAPQLPELDEAAIGSKFQQKWRELQKLLERQKSKGGIIDPEVESNRFLIHTNETPPAAGNLDADTSPGTREPSASHVPSCEAGVRADQFGSGLSHCRGGPGQRRQNQARGPRRGGRSRPQHRRAAPPITEHLDKLSLSSGCTEGPIRAKAQGNQMQQVNAELCQPKTGRAVYAEQQESLVSPDGQTECPKDAAGGRGHRGRRRGPHRADSDTMARGRYHWDGRASKSRGGGPGNPYSRGGGPHWSHDGGFQHKVVERRGEEVL